MIHTQFLGWGLQMTVLGMSLVFTLLALLWLLLTVVLKLDKEEAEEAEGTEEDEKKAPDAQEAVPEAAAETAVETTAAAPGVPEINGLPADLVAAILVAAHRHRQTLRRQAAPLARVIRPGSRIFASRWLATGRARQINNWQPRGR
jgi:Na+-transporting methylmalonyl-CoA/oxaloacetate decarboxylase gamma subunit